jgi:hypothetical protein
MPELLGFLTESVKAEDASSIPSFPLELGRINMILHANLTPKRIIP